MTVPSEPLNTAKVVDAAVVMLCEPGGLPLRLNAVARRLGVKPPALYNHVDSVQHLEELVGDRCWGSIARHCLQRLPDGTPPVQVVFQRLREFARTQPCVYTYAIQHPPRLDGPVPGEARQGVELFLDQVGLGRDAASSLHLVRSLVALVHGFVYLENSGLFVHNAPADDTFDWILARAMPALLGASRDEGT